MILAQKYLCSLHTKSGPIGAIVEMFLEKNPQGIHALTVTIERLNITHALLFKISYKISNIANMETFGRDNQ